MVRQNIQFVMDNLDNENNEITQLLSELQNKHITAEDINKIIEKFNSTQQVNVQQQVLK